MTGPPGSAIDETLGVFVTDRAGATSVMSTDASSVSEATLSSLSVALAVTMSPTASPPSPVTGTAKVHWADEPGPEVVSVVPMRLPQVVAVTGPEALSQREQVQIIGEVLGRALVWEDIHHDAARKAMVDTGWPPSYADGALDYFADLCTTPEPGSTVVADTTGRRARSFRQWAVEHADAFR